MPKNSKKKNYTTILIIAFLVFLTWQLPSLGNFRYPFMLLGTWFHEMGHGLTALILGGNFHYLEIYSNGGGVAYTSYPNNLSLPLNISKALSAAGGLLGPCLFGSIAIILSKHIKTAKYVLIGLIVLLTLSLFIWIRSIIGIAVLSLITLILIGIFFQKNSYIIQWTVLFLGVQSTLSTYLQIDYLFTSTFIRNGQQSISDTQSIANNLFGTYWMWAVIIIIISFFMLWKSYRYYLK